MLAKVLALPRLCLFFPRNYLLYFKSSIYPHLSQTSGCARSEENIKRYTMLAARERVLSPQAAVRASQLNLMDTLIDAFRQLFHLFL